MKVDFGMRKPTIVKMMAFSFLALTTVIASFPSIFEMEHPGMRDWLLLFIFWLMLSAGFFWMWKKIARPMLAPIKRRGQAAIPGFSIIISILLIITIPFNLHHYFNILLPVHTLEIQSMDGSKDKVDILAFKADWGKLPGGKINLPFTWHGKPGPQATIGFYPELQQHLVRVIWDGKETIVDLSTGVRKGGVLVTNAFEISILQTILYGFFFLISLISTVFWITILTIFLIRWYRSSQTRELSLMALPMLTVWTIYLLTFWPGLSSFDTIYQWNEAKSGVFTDAHPALDSMFIALVRHFIPSLAAIAFIQIAALALITTWGLIELNKRGLPAWATWGLAVGFALFPINSLMAVTVWKDTLYGVAVFAFGIQIIKIVFSNGEWLSNKWNLAGFILAGLAASFTRHNGLPFIIASLLVLFLPYRNQWKQILTVIIFTTGIWLLIEGPFYELMKIERYPGMANILLFEHIGAHLKAGTPIEKDDLAFLNNLIPIEKWPYTCFVSTIRDMDGPIPFEYFASADLRPGQIALNLFIKNPIVDLRHTLCAGALIWEINPGYQIHSLPMTAKRSYGMTSTSDTMANSLLPGLIQVIPIPPDNDAVMWKPAFYLLIFSISVLVLAIRVRNKKFLLILVPILIHSILMTLINYSNEFRYMFSTALLGLFSIGFVLLPISGLQSNNREDSETLSKE